MSLREQVVETFLERHVLLQDRWLDAVIEFVQEQRVPSSRQLSAVLELWLFTDLAVSSMPSLAQHGLNIADKKLELGGPVVVQVQCTCMVVVTVCVSIHSLVDVGAPFLPQYNTLTYEFVDNSGFEAVGESEREDRFEAKPRRMLSITVSDGEMQLKAAEMQPIPTLSLLTTPGAKLLLFPPLVCRRGILFLTPRNCQVLGGEVDDLMATGRPVHIMAAALGKRVPRSLSLNSRSLESRQSGQVGESNKENVASSAVLAPRLPSPSSSPPPMDPDDWDELEDAVDLQALHEPLPPTPPPPSRPIAAVRPMPSSPTRTRPEGSLSSTLISDAPSMQTSFDTTTATVDPPPTQAQPAVWMSSRRGGSVSQTGIRSFLQREVGGGANVVASPPAKRSSVGTFRSSNAPKDFFGARRKLTAADPENGKEFMGRSQTQSQTKVKSEAPDEDDVIVLSDSDEDVKPSVADLAASISRLSQKEGDEEKEEEEMRDEMEQQLTLSQTIKRRQIALARRSVDRKRSIDGQCIASQSPRLEKEIEEDPLVSKMRSLNIVRLADAVKKMKFAVGSSRKYVQAYINEVVEKLQMTDDIWTMKVVVSDDSMMGLHCSVDNAVLAKLIGLTCTEAMEIRRSGSAERRADGKRRLSAMEDSLGRMDLIIQVELYARSSSVPVIRSIETISQALGLC